MIQHDRRRTPGRRFPERRHDVRNRLRAPGLAVAVVALAIILYQVWKLIQN